MFIPLVDQTSEETGKGRLWLATGDAEYMHFQHDPDVDILTDESFAWHQDLNKDLGDGQFAGVNSIA